MKNQEKRPCPLCERHQRILCASCFVFWVMGTGRFTTGPAWRCAAGGCRVVLCPAAVPIAQGWRGLFLW